MFQIFFVPKEIVSIKNSKDAKKADKDLYIEFHRLLLEKDVFIPPSQFETCFLSAMHDDDVVEATIAAYEDVFRKLRGKI